MPAERIKLMAHLVAGYPDASGCRAAARGLVEGGAAYLEVQIPFSDPSADGPASHSAASTARRARSKRVIGRLTGGFRTLRRPSCGPSLRRLAWPPWARIRRWHYALRSTNVNRGELWHRDDTLSVGHRLGCRRRQRYGSLRRAA